MTTNVRQVAVTVVEGWARSALLMVLGVAVPALAAVVPVVDGFLVSPWAVANPWSWIGYLVLFVPAGLVLANPLGRATAHWVRRWTLRSVELRPEAPLETPRVVQLATGYWWNGYSYERTRRDAEADQRWRRLLAYPGYWRDVGWVIVAAVVVAPLCAVPVVSLAFAADLFTRGQSPVVFLGVGLLAVSVGSSGYAWRLAVAIAIRYFDRGTPTDPGDRVRELESQRADLTFTQAAELRRIERNLHDGAQARLVGVGLSLATAEALLETDPEQARDLLREARSGTSASLAELRSLVRGIDPPVLVERGLVEAVRALALDSPVDTTVDADPDIRLDTPVEAALYFGVAELLANAGKYAPAARALVAIQRADHGITCHVTDDGPGGLTERPSGGLAGIRRRLGTFDGTMTTHSPAGGPTSVQLWVPCESS